MKPEEALKELSYDDTAYGGKCTFEVRQEAVKALKKSIPMKPIGDLHSVPHYRCPACMLGHEELSTTQIYLDLTEDELALAHKKYVM